MNKNQVASLALASQVALIGACASARPREEAIPPAEARSATPTARITSEVQVNLSRRSHEDLVVITHPESDDNKRRQFQVLFGGLCDQDGQLCNNESDCECTWGKGALRNDDPEWEIKSGYAMIRGYRPRVRTSRSTAAAEGTDFFVQIDKSGDKEVHRFALLKGGPLALYKYVNNNKPDHPDDLTVLTPETTLKVAQTYAEVTVDSGGQVVIGPPKSFPPTDDGSPGANLRKLIVAVEAKPLAKATE